MTFVPGMILGTFLGSVFTAFLSYLLLDRPVYKIFNLNKDESEYHIGDEVEVEYYSWSEGRDFVIIATVTEVVFSKEKGIYYTVVSGEEEITAVFNPNELIDIEKHKYHRRTIIKKHEN